MAQQYPNRTDLQNPAQKVARQVAKGQQYGQAKQQMEAQRAVPMAAPVADIAPPPPAPGSLGSFDRATERASEPITAGMDFGPGPGPEVLAAPANSGVGSRADLIMRVRQAAAQYPNPNLIQLLIMLEGQ